MGLDIGVALRIQYHSRVLRPKKIYLDPKEGMIPSLASQTNVSEIADRGEEVFRVVI